jgi:hypothetical protein
MPLAPGTRLGPYEVQGALGAGGMGEVYRAHDTTLGRNVALKMLPDLVAHDPDRRLRFEREAQTLAALNHPNIAQVYGFEQSAGASALVMELVEGEDLAERIARGPIPRDEALPIARQIAQALESAHEAGIVHRDLKPANIKVKPDGTVKVLDFGLAKAVESGAGIGQPGTGGLANSPTITTPAMTQAGVILGTAAYMSPEQARGKVVDKRSDIWAFGCVLYEMLTGRRAFDGETITDVLAAVVQKSPDWAVLPAATPASVRAVLERCLEKDAQLRLRDIGEARIALGRPASETPMPVATPAPPFSRARRALIGTAILGVAVAAGLVGYFARPRAEPVTRKFQVAVRSDGARIQFPVISPDGRRVAYVANSRLWVQSLDEWEPRELAGTDAAVKPFWSPSGEWIGYFRSEQMLKAPVAGGAVVLVARLPAVQAPLGSASGVWTREGAILFSLASGPVYRVADTGGDLAISFQPPPEVGDLRSLNVLPGGAILATVRSSAASQPDAIGVVTSGTLKTLLEVSDVDRPRYAPSGHIIFERRSPAVGLWAVPFSVERLEVAGEPFLIGEGAEPSVADDGTLLFAPERGDLSMKLAWFSLDGRVGPTIAAPQPWREGLGVSPDGARLLASAEDGLWMFDVATGARQRITTSRSDVSPRFVGTTGQIVFVRGESGTPDVIMKPADAGGAEQVVARGGRFPSPTADGRRVVFNLDAMAAEVSGSTGRPPRSRWEVAWVDLDTPATIHRLGGAHRGARFPDVSPDGRLVAYVSGETGRDEIYLTQLPNGEGKWQLSDNGGGWVRIGPRNDRVVYRALNGDMMSVALGRGEGNAVTIGRPEKLFTWGSGWAMFYDLAPDGQRGVAAMSEAQAQAVSGLSIVQNWHTEFLARGR